MTDWAPIIMTLPVGNRLPAPSRLKERPRSTYPGWLHAISEYEVKFVYSNGVVHNVRTTKADNIFGGIEDPRAKEMASVRGHEGWIGSIAARCGAATNP